MLYFESETELTFYNLEDWLLPQFILSAGTGNEETMNQLPMPILYGNICKLYFTGYIQTLELCAGYVNGSKDFCAVSAIVFT